jgi:hypothetical protein
MVKAVQVSIWKVFNSFGYVRVSSRSAFIGIMFGSMSVSKLEKLFCKKSTPCAKCPRQQSLGPR